MAKNTKQVEQENFTRYERARLIGSRALQLSQGAPFMIKFTSKDLEELSYDPVKIAEREFKEGVLPITVKRPLPSERKK